MELAEIVDSFLPLKFKKIKTLILDQPFFL